jgi:hypothetical protein
LFWDQLYKESLFQGIQDSRDHSGRLPGLRVEKGNVGRS